MNAAERPERTRVEPRSQLFSSPLWIGSAVASVFSGLVVAAGFGGYVFAAIAAAAISARFLPPILKAIAGLAIGYGNALFALVAGALTNAAVAVLFGAFAGGKRGMTGYAVGVSLFSLGGSLIGTFVSYALVRGVAVPRLEPIAPVAAAPSIEELSAADADYATLARNARAAVSDTCNLLMYCVPDNLESRAGTALTELQLAADRLRRAEPPAEHLRTAHDALVDALRDLQDDVVALTRGGGFEPAAVLRSPALDRAERALSALGAY